MNDESTGTSPGTSNVGGIAGERLQQIIEKIERLEEEKKALADDIKDIMSEAKATGFEPKIIRTIVRLRKKAKEERQEEEELLELYKAAIGMD
jgi:uncharacterized protein (UPF0335 family)